MHDPSIGLYRERSPNMNVGALPHSILYVVDSVSNLHLANRFIGYALVHGADVFYSPSLSEPSIVSSFIVRFVIDIDDEDQITGSSTVVQSFPSTTIVSIVVSNGHLWTFARSYNGRIEVFSIGVTGDLTSVKIKTDLSSRINIAAHFKQTIVWNSESRLFKTTNIDTNVQFSTQLFLPIEKVDAIYINEQTEMIYVVGNYFSGQLILLEIDNLSFKVSRMVLLNVRGVGSFIFEDSPFKSLFIGIAVVYGVGSEHPFVMRVDIEDMKVHDDPFYTERFYTESGNPDQRILMPYRPHKVPETNELYVLGGPSRTGGFYRANFIVDMCDQYTDCQDCSRDSYYCGYCFDNKHCSNHISCDIFSEFCPSINSIDPALFDLPSVVNISGTALDIVTANVQCVTNCSAEETPLKVTDGTLQCEVKGDLFNAASPSCSIGLKHNDIVYTSIDQHVYECQPMSFETCLSTTEYNPCVYCTSSHSCSSPLLCDPEDSITQKLTIQNMQNYIANKQENLTLRISEISYSGALYCVVNDNLPVALQDSVCPYVFPWTDESATKAASVHLAIRNNNDYMKVSNSIDLTFYNCSNAMVCSECGQLPMCQWCNNDLGSCHIFHEAPSTCDSIPAQQCRSVTSISPVTSYNTIPSTVTLTGNNLDTLSEHLSWIRCVIWTSNGIISSASISLTPSNDIECIFNDDQLLREVVRVGITRKTDLKPIVKTFDILVYTCEADTCYDCLSEGKDAVCHWTGDQACSHETPTGTNFIVNFAECPQILNISPRRGIGAVATSLKIEGVFYCVDDTITLYGYRDDDETSLALTVDCSSSPIYQITSTLDSGDFEFDIRELSVFTTRGYTNRIEFSTGDCNIEGDCNTCHNLHPHCVYCHDVDKCTSFTECNPTSANFELERSCNIRIEPPYGDISGGDTIVIYGGPFVRELISPYVCAFGSRYTPSEYFPSDATLTNRLICTVPVGLALGDTSFALQYARRDIGRAVFTYVSCITLSRSTGCHDAMCTPDQLHCGWCAGTRSCTLSSRCDDIFMTDCISISDYNTNSFDLLGPATQVMSFSTNLPIYVEEGDENMTLRRDVLTSDFVCEFGDIRVEAEISGGIYTCLIPTDSVEKTIPFALSKRSQGFDTIALTNPFDFHYVNCSKHETCSACKSDGGCGWCLTTNECSSALACPGIHALNQCPEIQTATPDSIEDSNTFVTLTGQFFKENLFVNISGDFVESSYVSDTELNFVSPLYSGPREINLVDEDGKTYSDGFIVISYFGDNSLYIGLGVGIALLLIIIVAVILVVMFLRRRKGGLRMVEPDYLTVAFGADLTLKHKISSGGLPLLEQALQRPDFEFQLALGAVCDSSDQDEIGKSLIRIAYYQGLSLNCLSAIARQEISSCEVETTIFRGNSVASKMFTAYARMVGIRYLYRTIGRLIKELEMMSSDKSESGRISNEASLMSLDIELDMNQIDENEIIDEDVNAQSLQFTCQKIFSEIRKSSSQGLIPSDFLGLFYEIRTSSHDHFGSGDAIYSAIGGLFFLRFVCPAITCPHIYGLTQVPPNPVFQRQLILISKILQSIANMTIPGKKEQYLELVTDFVQKNISKVKQFYEEISDGSRPATENPVFIEMPDEVLKNALASTWNVLLAKNVQSKMKEMFNDRDNGPELVNLYNEMLEAYPNKIVKHGKKK